MNYSEWLENARSFHRQGHTRPVAFRFEQLDRLAAAITSREQALLDSLKKDLGKPAAEAYASEIGFVLQDIRHARAHLKQWMRPRRRAAPLMTWPSRGIVRPEPKGVVLILGPWNYPLQLLLSPLVPAIAAGNCAALKPSELAPATSAAVTELIRETFQSEFLAIFEGEAETARDLLALPFDHVFFTGSTATGRKVMQAAAENLTPVTLELGGRNPCLVCADADLRVAARRIARGKFFNAGQTCVAPDHVLAQRSVYDRLLEKLCATVREFYGPDARKSPDYGRIVSDRHWKRLKDMLEGVAVRCGGDLDEKERYLGPTIVLSPDPSAPLMQEEIFGPILPVVPFDDLNSLTEDLAKQPHPLALYVFTQDKEVARRVLERIPSGGACINDTLSHIISRDMPFGGIGESGIGAYHGKAGFDCFTHYRSVLSRSTRIDPRSFYPPMKTPLDTLKKFYRFVAGP